MLMRMASVVVLGTSLLAAPQTAPPSAPPAPRAAIAAAIARAATDDIRVLIVWRGPDDPRTQSFNKVKQLPEMTRNAFFSNEFQTVNVDMGRADKNLDVAAAYGAKITADNLPAFTVLDTKGKPIAQATAKDFISASDPQALDAAAVAAFLVKQHAIPPDPNQQFETARKQAKDAGKVVFVWFSAPW